MPIEQPDLSEFMDVAKSGALLFILGMLLTSLVVILLYYIGWWITNRPGSSSPYTGKSMVPGEALHYEDVEAINQFLTTLPQPGNPFFDLEKSAICRVTGRIFPHSLNGFGIVKVSWNFLQKHHRGEYVVWGSLPLEKQEQLKALHGSLENFQTEHSSTNPDPKEAKVEFVLTKPGPLYVDLKTNNLLGWQVVPGTDLEVLVYREV